jgi:rubrerythrin
MSNEWTVRKAVEFAVKTERLGAVFYKKMAKKFADNAEMKEVFDLLAKDEEIHEHQFTKLLETLEPAGPGESESLAVLRVMSMSQFFLGEDGLYGNPEEITDVKGALVRAFEMEKATLHYYQSMLDVLGDNPTVKAIVKAEKNHMMKMAEYLMTEAKFRGIADNF